MTADVTYRQLVNGLRALGLGPDRHVVAHASLSSFGRVRGGAEAVAAALAATCGSVVVPAFTYQTLVVPPSGPPDNGVEYDDYADQNALSEFWRPDLPVHRTVGAVPEALRAHPDALRSDHPVLSFVAVGRVAPQVVNAQLLTEPFAPLDVLLAHDGDLVLLGVGLTRAAVIHLAERRAGRRSFVRWALTTQPAPAQGDPAPEAGTRRAPIHAVLFDPPPEGATSIREIPEFPGCSEGFGALAPHVADLGECVQIGNATVWRYPLAGIVSTAMDLLRDDPAALLCGDRTCARCNAVRAAVRSGAGSGAQAAGAEH